MTSYFSYRSILTKIAEIDKTTLSAIENSTEIVTEKQQRSTEEQRTFRVATIVLLQ